MDAYIGMVSIFGFNFAPRGWALCQGQLLAINTNTALFSLLGTTYGGNGVQTFALPDLRGRVPLGFNQGPGLSAYTLGQAGGTENTTLTTAQMPSHTHQMMASNDPQSVGTPSGNALGSGGRSGGGTIYAPGVTNMVNMGAATSIAGGNQPFPTLQPYLAMNYSICTQGIFPTRD